MTKRTSIGWDQNQVAVSKTEQAATVHCPIFFGSFCFVLSDYDTH